MMANALEPSYGPLRLITLQGTSLCNLNCSYCYLSEEERAKNNVMSLETAKSVFKELVTTPYANEEPISILWHTGEPLALKIEYYEELFALFSQISDEYKVDCRRFVHIFQTNGTLLSQQWCDFIKKHKIKIGVSIDGPDFIHDAHRVDKNGNPTHAKVMRGIKLLQENEIDFGVIAVITRLSLNYPDEIIGFFKENEIYNLNFNLEETEGCNQTSSLESFESECKVFMKRLWQLTKAEDCKIRVREFKYIAGAILNIESALDDENFELVQTNQLTIPFMTLNIDSLGNFSTYSPELLTMKSSHYGDFILGNVKTDTLESVTCSDKFRTINRDIQAGVNRCYEQCDYFDMSCVGGRPSNKYHENGSFDTMETRECRLRTKMITDLILEDLESEVFCA